MHGSSTVLPWLDGSVELPRSRTGVGLYSGQIRFVMPRYQAPETERRLPGNRCRLTCYSCHGAKGTNVNDQILNAIDEEIAKLRQARAILAESGNAPVRKTSTAAVTHNKPRRELSAKARKAIADAQRKRWAKVKSQNKAALPAPAGKK
jgi:hypothetical protein